MVNGFVYHVAAIDTGRLTRRTMARIAAENIWIGPGIIPHSIPIATSAGSSARIPAANASPSSVMP